MCQSMPLINSHLFWTHFNFCVWAAWIVICAPWHTVLKYQFHFYLKKNQLFHELIIYFMGLVLQWIMNLFYLSTSLINVGGRG